MAPVESIDWAAYSSKITPVPGGEDIVAIYKAEWEKFLADDVQVGAMGCMDPDAWSGAPREQADGAGALVPKNLGRSGLGGTCSDEDFNGNQDGCLAPAVLAPALPQPRRRWRLCPLRLGSATGRSAMRMRARPPSPAARWRRTCCAK